MNYLYAGISFAVTFCVTPKYDIAQCLIYQDLRKISLKPSFLRSLRSYAFGTLRERGSLFRDLCVSPLIIKINT